MTESKVLTKTKLITALGGDFTTRKKIAEVLHYKNPASVDRYLKGLPRVCGTRYWTEDVVARILQEGLK